MRKVLFGVLITLLILFTFKYCGDKRENEISLQTHSTLIREQVKNVGKLVVTEGHFSEVYTYKKSKAYFSDLYQAEKRAIVIVNADVTIAYDLSLIAYDIDEVTKTLSIVGIPEEEIKISPDFEYYDIESDFLNNFEAKDYNEIKANVNASLMKKVESSNLKSNAKNRLISELAKFYILTSSLGWTLEYNNNPVNSLTELEHFKN